MKKKQLNLTSGPILRTLSELALPIMASSFLSTAYNITDMAWIGLLGSKAVAGVGVGGMFTWFSQGFAILARTGGQVKTAHCLGAGENDSAAQYARGALQLGILFAVLYGLVSLFGASRLIGFFKLNSPEVIAQAEWYVRIACGLVIFSYLNAILTGLLTAAGNSRTPFIVNVAGLVFNVVLDPVLIFGIGPFPELGVSGAAAATVTAQALVSLLFFKAVLREKVLFPHLRLWVLVPVKVWREIVRIGVPSAVQNLIYAGISMILTRLITGWGDLAVAAQRVGSQIESVSWMVGDGFSAAVNAFLGQNYGAKRYDRVRRGYFCAIAMTAAWGLCTTFLLIGMARPLFSIFLQEEEVMAIGVNYLRIVGLSQMFMMVEQTSIGAFSGLGRTLYPSIVSVTFTSARIPVAVLLSSVMGLSGIWWALSISSMVKGCILFVSFVLFLYVFLERKKDEKTV